MANILQQPHICDLHHDIMSLIMKNKMNYEECVMVNKVLGMNLSRFDMFIMIVDNKLCSDTICFHKMSFNDFYDIIEYSAFEFNNIIKVIYDIAYNKINNINKYDINLQYILQFDKSTRDSSIMCMKILLTMIDFYVTGEFMINNPYYYLQTYISNILMNYIVDDVQQSYYISKNENIISKFRLILFQSKWYKTNIDIYQLFKTYIHHSLLLQNEYKIITMEPV